MQELTVPIDADADAVLLYCFTAVQVHVCVASYDMVQKLPPDQLARDGVVICDESHLLKSRTTKRTQHVAALVKRAARAVLITGTPLLSKPIEVFTQVRGFGLTVGWGLHSGAWGVGYAAVRGFHTGAQRWVLTTLKTQAQPTC